MRLANEWLPCSVHMGLEIQSGPVPSRAPPATRITKIVIFGHHGRLASNAHHPPLRFHATAAATAIVPR